MRLQEFTRPPARGRTLLAALAALALAGCLPGPDYHAPEMALPARYARLAPAPVVSPALQTWWTGFHDPVLDRLIAQGLSGNVSIAIAEARLREAAAMAHRAGSMVSGSLTQSRTNGSFGSAGDQTTVGLTAGLMGAQQRGIEAALDRLSAAGYGVQDARLKLIGSLAQAYVTLRFYQASLAEQQASLVSRRETLDRIRVLLQSGEVTRLDELRAEALVADAQAALPQTQANVLRQVSQIATLVGVPSAMLDTDLTYRGRQPRLAAPGGIGVPADLVRRRPDIRAAERAYAAAVADIGSAIGARYPSLSLTGQIVAPATPGYLLTRTLTAGLVLPLFDQPGLAAAVNVARARADQAYQTWRGTVLQAVEDVETALAQVAGARAAAQAADRAVKLDVEALALSRQLLTGTGSVTVLDVLDREQALTTARATAASARRDEALSAIGLYVALGLGPEAGAEAGAKAGSGQP